MLCVLRTLKFCGQKHLVSKTVYYKLKFEIQPTCSPILVKFHITKVNKVSKTSFKNKGNSVYLHANENQISLFVTI